MSDLDARVAEGKRAGCAGFVLFLGLLATVLLAGQCKGSENPAPAPSATVTATPTK